jgi:hypothetical protein
MPPAPGDLPTRTTTTALLHGFPCSQEVRDLLRRHRVPKTVECKPHDGAAADDLPAAAAHVCVLAFAQPQVVLAIQPHLARLERDGDIRRGNRSPGLLVSCRRAACSRWPSRSRSLHGRSPGGGRRCARFVIGCGRRLRMSFAVARTREVDYLSALILWLRTCLWRGRTGMARRKRPPGAAGLLLLHALAQLSHRTPPRS